MKALMLIAATVLLTGCATYRYKDGYYSGYAEYHSAYPTPYYGNWGYAPYNPYYAPTYYYGGGRYIRRGDRDDYRRHDHDRHGYREHREHHEYRRYNHRQQRSSSPRRQRHRPIVKERRYLDRNRLRRHGH